MTQTSLEPPVATSAPKSKRSSTQAIFGDAVYRHGFVGLPSVLVRGQARLQLSPTEFNIVVQLLSYWIDPKRPPFPSKKDLARRMGLNPATVRINIAKLEERGLVRREQRKTASGDWNSNIYHLDGLVDAIKAIEPDFEEERQARSRKQVDAEMRSETDAAEERSRRRGVRRRR